MSKNKSLSIYQPMRYRLLYFMISLTVILPGIYSLMKYGLNLSIDFTGGSNIVLEKQDTNIKKDKIRSSIGKDIEVFEIKELNNRVYISTSPISQKEFNSIEQKLKTIGVTTKEFSTVGATLGNELIKKTVYGVALASILILIYVAFRFQNLKFGISAILAMLHDTLVLLGTFSLLGHYMGIKIDSLFVTAVLTILSFSVHDTIVVYDRIRELKKKHAYLEFDDAVNRAVVETLGRSINNSMTIIFMLLAMYLLGGSTIRNFILALLIGTISGTYSSTFTAAPLLVSWNNWETKRKNKKI